MTEFTSELREIAAGLDLPGPVRVRILLELGGDLDDMRDALGAVDHVSVLLAWLKRDAAIASLGLIVGSLAIALWIWLSASIARV